MDEEKVVEMKKKLEKNDLKVQNGGLTLDPVEVREKILEYILNGMTKIFSDRAINTAIYRLEHGLGYKEPNIVDVFNYVIFHDNRSLTLFPDYESDSLSIHVKQNEREKAVAVNYQLRKLKKDLRTLKNMIEDDYYPDEND